MTDREIDALVAEKVFGCKVEWYQSIEGTRLPDCKCSGKDHRSFPWLRTYHDGDGMLAVIEAMREKGWRFEGEWYPGANARALFFINPKEADADWGNAGAATLPRAVALAALRALGVEVEG